MASAAFADNGLEIKRYAAQIYCKKSIYYVNRKICNNQDSTILTQTIALIDIYEHDEEIYTHIKECNRCFAWEKVLLLFRTSAATFGCTVMLSPWVRELSYKKKLTSLMEDFIKNWKTMGWGNCFKLWYLIALRKWSTLHLKQAFSRSPLETIELIRFEFPLTTMTITSELADYVYYHAFIVLKDRKFVPIMRKEEHSTLIFYFHAGTKTRIEQISDLSAKRTNRENKSSKTFNFENRYWTEGSSFLPEATADVEHCRKLEH